MKAEIKSIYSTEVDNLPNYKPNKRDEFCIDFRFIIGPMSEPGEESFDITVLTPKWLLSHYDLDDIIMGRHRVIVFEYNYERLIAKINRWLEFCTGDTWEEVATKVSRIGHWEFEDYTEYKE